MARHRQLRRRGAAHQGFRSAAILRALRRLQLRAGEPRGRHPVRADRPADQAIMSVLAQDVADDRDDDAVVAPTARWRRAVRWLRRNPVSAAAIAVIGLLVFVAVFAPVLEPYKPDVPDPM